MNKLIDKLPNPELNTVDMPLARQSELYLDVLRDRKLRYLLHRPVVRFDVNDPSVNPELPVVECVSSLTRRGFPRSNLQPLRWKRLRTFALDPCLLCDLFDLPGKPLQLLEVRTGQLDPGVLWHLFFGGRLFTSYLGVHRSCPAMLEIGETRYTSRWT